MPEPYYTTAAALRTALGVSKTVLSDEDAVDLIEAAEDLIDERLGNRPIDEASGRKVIPAEVEGWQSDKLAKATIELARVLYEDPGVERRQRQRSTSGDVAVSGPYGPAYGERFAALLAASKLMQPWAAAGTGPLRSSNAQKADTFFTTPP